MITNRSFRVTIALLAPALALSTRPVMAAGGGEDPWCGTHPARLAATLAEHQDAMRRQARESVLAEQAGSPAQARLNVDQYDQIAVIEDDGTVIQPPRPFDLSGKSIQFLRRPKGMSAVRSPVGYKNLIGNELSLFLFDHAYVPFAGALRFPFFGKVYDGVWVSEDGYLAFGTPDIFRPRESALDMLLGSPAIAPVFTDLDRDAATGRGGIYVNLLPHRLRVTWLEMPEADTGNLVTAQVTLFDTGRILFAYRDVGASRAMVGIFPGAGATDDARHLDFDVELPQPPRRAALFESFIDEEQVDEFALIEAFYRHFQDRYGHLVVWFDFPLATGDGDGAFQLTLKNEVRGIGVPVFDASRFMGLERLESYVQMGYLGRYPDDPEEILGATLSTMDLLAHQVGHRWLGLVTYKSHGAGNDGADVLNLLDSQNLEHWSFYLDTDASFLGGNDIQDNGDGTFTTVGTTSRYSDLDLYLMGLVPAEAVPSFFYVGGATAPASSSEPQMSVTLNGHRVDVAMSQVTESMGPRVPAYEDAPEVLDMAFVLLARQGETPSVESLEKLNGFRRYWHRFFKESTGFHGRVNTALRPK